VSRIFLKVAILMVLELKQLCKIWKINMWKENNMIKKFELRDLTACAEIMMSVYNNEFWQCSWSLDTAKNYLMDYVECKKFIGYTLWLDDVIKGVIFCHEKVWWNNNEVFIDEMFISPELQRQGYGTELLSVIENYIKEHNLAG